MTRVTQLRLRGFKSIEELDVQLGGVTVVTGRNNSGKTSLLEAIDLAFTPANVTRYGENLGYLINSERSSASIDVEYQERQRQLTEYQSESDSHLQRAVSIRKCSSAERVEYLHSALYDVLELNEEYPISSINSLSQSESDSSEVNPLIRETLHETVSDLSEKELFDALPPTSILLLNIDDIAYPVVHLGDGYEQLRQKIITRSVQSFVDKKRAAVSDMEESLIEELHHTFNRLLAPRFGRTRFIDGKPPELAGVHFVDDARGDTSKFDHDKEDDAVRVSKIEQYLKENDILDDLQDFSFNKVVFDGDDGPYDVPYEFLGDGVKVIVRVLWSLFDESRSGDILLLEEPEIHMHPGYIEELVGRLVDIARDRGIQLLVTTHNRDFIDAFFSPNVRGEREAYLQDEFRLVQLTGSVPKTFDYEQAETNIEELDLDLRGV